MTRRTHDVRTAASRRLLAAEGRWLMGRVMPHALLDGIGKSLRHAAPEHADDVVAAIRARAAELVEADEDLVVDGPSQGMLAVSAVVLAAFEALLPVFDGDRRRTILYLQHVFGQVLRRPLEAGVAALARGEDPLEAVDAACRKDVAMYGSAFDIAFERPDPGTFEMRVGRCFFRDFFARHDAVLLTTVLCAWDANWMRALDPAASGLRSERTSLLSLGDEACVFRILRTDDPLAGHADALDRRFAGERAPG